MRAVAVLHDIRGVLLVGENHLISQKPVAHGAGISFCVTVDRYIGASWRTDKLIRHEDHWRNWNVRDRFITPCSILVLSIVI